MRFVKNREHIPVVPDLPQNISEPQPQTQCDILLGFYSKSIGSASRILLAVIAILLADHEILLADHIILLAGIAIFLENIESLILF